jgi:hypothetical protein
VPVPVPVPLPESGSRIPGLIEKECDARQREGEREGDRDRDRDSERAGYASPAAVFQLWYSREP